MFFLYPYPCHFRTPSAPGPFKNPLGALGLGSEPFKNTFGGPCRRLLLMFTPSSIRVRFRPSGEALEALQFIHYTCSKAAGRLKRFARIEWLGVSDIRIARSFCKKDEECTLAIVVHQQRESLYLHLEEQGEEHLVPEHLEWAAPAAEEDAEKDDDKKILPRVLQYDENFNLLNEQRIVVDEEEGEEEIKFALSTSKQLEWTYEDWRAILFHVLKAADDKFTEERKTRRDRNKEGQHDLRVYRVGSAIHVQAMVDFPENDLVLVPSVMTTSQIAKKANKDVKNESKFTLLECPPALVDEDHVHVLVNPNKYPKKKPKSVDKKAVEKEVVILAWAAKRSSKTEECNMFKTMMPADEVLTLGDSECCLLASSNHVTFPVYCNSEKAIKKGDEIIIYYEDQVKKPEKKEKKKRSWKDAIPKGKAKAKGKQ